jgi:very-short-patch-repair endonuclease
MHQQNGPSLLSRLPLIARQNRGAPTRSERKLWNALRMRKLGVRVRRQWVLAPYVVDFFVPAYKLVIEVDGGYHLTEEQRTADAHRERELVRLHGVRVVRFSAELVESRPAAVVAQLLEIIRR